MFLEGWLKIEKSFGSELGDVSLVQAKWPKKLKKKKADFQDCSGPSGGSCL